MVSLAPIVAAPAPAPPPSRASPPSLSRCPYCSQPLATAPTFLRCACAEHPILDQTPCLADDRALGWGHSRWSRARKLLATGDPTAAIAAALAPSLRTPEGRALAVALRIGRAPRRLRARVESQAQRLILENQTLTFTGAALLLRNKGYAQYLAHRFANPSIIVAGALIALLKNLDVPSPRILDVGGGAGHASFLLSLARPDGGITIADEDFTNLYLARRFMAPGAHTVCLDAEAPLPYGPDSFDVVFSLDAFHFLRSKALLLAELRRTAARDALWIFPHLHNARASNPTPGIPLSIAGYRALFPAARFFREDILLRDYLLRRTIDLSPAAEAAVGLDSAAAFCALQGPDWLWQRHSLSGAYLEAPLALNPLYSAAQSGELARRWPTPALERECGELNTYLPASVRITPEMMALLRARPPATLRDQPRLGALAEAMVAIPLPEQYAPAG